MPRRSAGVLLYRYGGPETGPGKGPDLQVLLAHPGGPFWVRKDEGAWSIPKGEYDESEDPWRAAQREFAEELGTGPPAGPRVDLGEICQAGGKVVTVFAVRGDLDAAAIVSNTFELEWPRGSGRLREFPEVDRAGWFGLDEARAKLLKSQLPVLDRLLVALR